MIHPVDYAPSQNFGDNPTRDLPASSWIIKQFGNYQPDGHTGTDYPCPVGTPVRAAADGTVLHAGYYGGTYADNPYWISPGFAGYCYVVDHGAFIGIYGHCRDGGALVHAGQRVTEGQILGPSGNTGASTGQHLHFEVLPDGFVLNSYMYGRINPARLFAGITPQGTITPITEEGFLMALSDQDQIEVRDNLRKLVQAADDEKAFDAGVNEKVDEIVGNLRKTFWNTEESKALLANTPAAELAIQIDAAGLAAAVRDELVKLLAK